MDAMSFDLCDADEAVVEEPALSHQEDVGGGGEHLGADGGTDLVGRSRQLARHEFDADHAAFEQHGQVRRLAALGDGRGHQGLTDAGEEDLAVLQQPAGGDRHDLVGPGVGVLRRELGARAEERVGQREAQRVGHRGNIFSAVRRAASRRDGSIDARYESWSG
jgi:hypothetical protein